MSRFTAIILSLFASFITFSTHAKSQGTMRIPMFSNPEVTVWKTVIYPNKNQILTMHRHEKNRVVVALDTGTLKITDNKEKVHYLTLEKDHAYYLAKDVPGELHTDENMSAHPLKVIVIELNK